MALIRKLAFSEKSREKKPMHDMDYERLFPGERLYLNTI